MVAIELPNDKSTNAGHVRVYQSGSNWTQLGVILISDVGIFGWSVSLSSDGTTVAASVLY